MESGDLRIFQCVAQEGNLTKAASKLGYVQSNVTARIRHLEAEVGTTLFIRHNRGMTLSPAGAMLLTYADKIIGLLNDASKALRATSTPSGPLRIGSTQTAAAVRLPELFAKYYQQYPEVSLSLATGNSQMLIDQVIGYELEGAFIGCSCDHPDIESIDLFDEELFVVSSGVGPEEELTRKPILVYSMGCSYRQILEEWLLSSGVNRPVIMEFGTLEAIISGVTSGMGISLLPEIVIRQQIASGNLRKHSLPSGISRMMTHFITRKDAFVSSALGAFIAMLPREYDMIESGNTSEV
ncbi:LysR family transcriptional regulator [Paenibacillus sp. UASWS1643]|uniref:LysR family transcriptional regulator n=1 Tax=Paenibacillus sp. UASWS1643 TaxID=2580422 RepID=UPI00123C28A4|nr:LysR family transcriptional regulator [Paenibacillus sp. UASWS1643]KAA8755463.1 LysR family transcriptional regulator [Paenibacillus sp. UASWS1643]